MTSFHFIGVDDLPEPIKRALMERGQGDKQIAQAKHELLKRDEAAFWESLSREQLHWLLRLFNMMDGEENVAEMVSRELGRAEAYMEIKFKSCACGEIHRDADDFMKEIVDRASAMTVEERELRELGLSKVEESIFSNPKYVGKFHCNSCHRIFESIEERKSLAVGKSHDGCISSD